MVVTIVMMTESFMVHRPSHPEWWCFAMADY
jgi:hypothetical protein